jgi:hypothetical protein
MWISTSVSAANPDWPKSLILATASPGGVYQIYGDELAQILKENLGISVNALATQGPVHNVKLLENGDAQLGMITMGVGLHGWNGIGDWTNGKQFRNMRVLFPMYDTPFQAVALRRSGIAMFAQLEKKIIGIGPRAGTGGTYIPTILKLLGISAEVRYASFDVVAEKLLTGQYDAIVTLTGVPVPAVEQVAAKGPVTLLGLSPEQIEAIRKGLPEFTGSNIADRTYEFQLKDYGTIGMYNFAVGRPDLPDDLVYHLVKAALQNQQRLVKAHPAARETVSENILKDSFMPLHRGAVRYYQEIGIHIPDILN